MRKCVFMESVMLVFKKNFRSHPSGMTSSNAHFCFMHQRHAFVQCKRLHHTPAARFRPMQTPASRAGGMTSFTTYFYLIHPRHAFVFVRFSASFVTVGDYHSLYIASILCI
jgi:hypothetical protein